MCYRKLLCKLSTIHLNEDGRNSKLNPKSKPDFALSYLKIYFIDSLLGFINFCR